MECGHSSICLQCATDVLNQSPNCYLCQKPVSFILLIEQLKEEGLFKVKKCIFYGN